MAQNIPDILYSLRRVEGAPNSSPETKLYLAGCVFMSSGADFILPAGWNCTALHPHAELYGVAL